MSFDLNHRCWRAAGLSVAMLSAGGCFSLRGYDRAELHETPAHINGDYRVTAGLPVKVLLREVDDQPLKFWQHAADVSAGEHRLLVDCSVADGNHLSRHELNVDTDAGVTYRLRAEATSQSGCTRVYMEATRF